jgi:hypothetical protein
LLILDYEDYPAIAPLSIRGDPFPDIIHDEAFSP